MNHQDHFTKLFGYAKELRSRYLRACAAQSIFDRLNELNVINKVGKKRANENIKIINFHKYFFMTIKESTRCYFLIELAKFFDTSSQSLTIHTVLEYTEKNLGSFSTEQFEKCHKDREIFPELFKDFKPLSKKDVNKLKQRLLRNKDTIKRLKTYRDQVLAHDDMKKRVVQISNKDVRVLTRIIEDTIELLYSKLEFSSNMYGNFKDEPKREFDHIMSKLVAQEKQRIKEIEQKYAHLK